MYYQSIEELPIHCRINLPEAAQHVYRDAWNRTWDNTGDAAIARDRAWREVREHFERDTITGRWMRRAASIPLRAVSEETNVVATAV